MMCMLWASIGSLLCGGQGRGSLPECASSVSDYVARLVASVPDATRSSAAVVLNAPFTLCEVEAALRKMHYGRMAGPDGLKGELFKGAYIEVRLSDGKVKHEFVLCEELLTLLSAAFKSGQIPEDWCAALLVAVFKKGDASNLDNYRGIAAGCALGKLFSLILDARLSGFCEQYGIRAKGQAGFRHGRRTSDHVFILKHLIDKYRSSRKHLYVCFIDFKKAYDSVRHDLLMRCLADIGLHGEMLTALASMYWQPP